jgi:hypothetical protein
MGVQTLKHTDHGKQLGKDALIKIIKVIIDMEVGELRCAKGGTILQISF